MKRWINDYGDIPWWYWTPAMELRWQNSPWMRDGRSLERHRNRAFWMPILLAGLYRPI